MEGRPARFLFLIPISLFIFMAYNARSQSSNPSAKASAAPESEASIKSGSKKLSPAANAWVEATLRKMTVDEKIGQLLFTTYHASFTATDAPPYHHLLPTLHHSHLGAPT